MLPCLAEYIKKDIADLSQVLLYFLINWRIDIQEVSINLLGDSPDISSLPHSALRWTFDARILRQESIPELEE